MECANDLWGIAEAAKHGVTRGKILPCDCARMEGENLGELGSGFNNSNYWLGQAFYHSGGMSEHPIFPHLRRDVEDFVGDCHDARCLLRTMGPKWEPKLFNNLCEDALLTEDQSCWSLLFES